MLQLLHAADLHLDASFSGVSKEKAMQRREEQRDILNKLVQVAQDGKADLVLLSGDLLDNGEQAYGETLQALIRALGQMGCPVFISPGNHDPYNSRSVYRQVQWPDNVHIFTSGEVERISLPELGCTVYGAAFISSVQEVSLLHGFSVEEDDSIGIGVFHGDVGGKGAYGSISAEEIAGSGLDYLALGHIHLGSGLQKSGHTHWAYPGCTEGRGYDELGDKGCLWVTVDKEQVASRFVPLATRRYELLEVEVGQSALASLLEVMPADARQHSYRIRFVGESSVEGLDLESIKSQVEPLFYGLSLKDATTVPLNLWERSKEDTLTGLFLQSMKMRLEQAETPEEKNKLEQAVRFGLSALEHREEPMA